MRRFLFIFILFYFNTAAFSQNVLLEQQKTNIIYAFYDNIFNIGMDTCGIGKLFFKPSTGTIQQSNNQIHWYIKSFHYSSNETLTIGYVNNESDSIFLEKRAFFVRKLPKMEIVFDQRIYPGHFRGDLNSRLKYLKEVKVIVPTISDTFQVIHFDFLIKYEDEILPMLYSNWGNQVNEGIRGILTGSRKIDAVVLTNFSIEKNGKYANYISYYNNDWRFYFTNSQTKRGTYPSFFDVLEEDALFYSIFNTKLDDKPNSVSSKTTIADTINIELKSYHRNFSNYLEDSTVIVSTKTSLLYEFHYFSDYALVKSYHRNGKLKQKGFIEQDCGRQELSNLSFDPDTFKDKMHYFKLLDKKGEWQTYNEKGELIYKRYYKCGELIKEKRIPIK